MTEAPPSSTTDQTEKTATEDSNENSTAYVSYSGGGEMADSGTESGSDPAPTSDKPPMDEVSAPTIDQPIEEVRTRRTTSGSSRTTTKTVSTAPMASTPASEPASAAGNLGIAAGGGLVYLGQGDLDKYFQDLQALGADWVRWDIDWRVVQPDSRDRYDWSDVDRVANTAQRYGVKSLAIITYAPRWAQAGSCPEDVKCPPANPDDFARFAGATAARYKSAIGAYEIWNEQNWEGDWYPSADAKEYAAFLKGAYAAIKQAAPGAIVLTGGMATVQSDDGSNITMPTFIKQLYAAGAGKYFDAVAVHPYSYPFTTSSTNARDAWLQIAPLHEVMAQNGDTGKKIWVTEYGAPTGGPGTAHGINDGHFSYDYDYLTEAALSQLARQMIVSWQADRSWMGPFFWYSLKDEGTSRSTAENFFGLTRADGSQKEIYGIIKNAFN